MRMLRVAVKRTRCIIFAVLMFKDYRIFIFSVKSQCTELGLTIQIKARILIFPGTDFYFPSTSVPPGTFFGLC